MGFLFTSESVSEGHPDKVADQISDALLDEFLRCDPNSKVAAETFVTTGLVVCGGEVKTNGYVPVEKIARQVIQNIGYTKSDYQFDAKSCGILSSIHEQSGDINQGVERESKEQQGAGDQGMMFGYACSEMDNYMPMTVEVAHLLLQMLSEIRFEGREMTYLRPDSKSQVTVEYNDNNEPVRVDTLVLSTQHDEFILPEDDSEQASQQAEKAMQEKIRKDIEEILIPRMLNSEDIPARIKKLFDDKGYRLLVNPTGKFVIGGPHGDTGLTGRKIIVDTYGGRGAHGGGAFSGKDSSKVDRSAAYAARHLAKNMVAAGIADEVLVQVAYAIGKAEPVGLFINTNNTAKVYGENGNPLSDNEIAAKIAKIYDLRPYNIVQRFGLTNPIFAPTAAYGHFGREPYEKEVDVYYDQNGQYHNGNKKFRKKVKFFGWEDLDFVDEIKDVFNL